MRHKAKRLQVTMRISADAKRRLESMYVKLLKDKPESMSSNDVSHGKIVEVLLLKGDAFAYVQKNLLLKD